MPEPQLPIMPTILDSNMLRDLLKRIPRVVLSEGEIYFSNAEVGSVIIELLFSKEDKDRPVRNGYNIYYVSDEDISAGGYSKDDTQFILHIRMHNGNVAYKVPPASLDVVSQEGGYNLVSSKYIKDNFSNVLTTDMIATTLNEKSPRKIPNSATINILNDKLERSLDLLCSNTFIDTDGTETEVGTMYHKVAVVQTTFDAGTTEIVLNRTNLLNEDNITKYKMVKAYITSEIEDGVYPYLMCIVTPDAIKVKAIVANKAYEATSSFDVNIEIGYNYLVKDNLIK